MLCLHVTLLTRTDRYFHDWETKTQKSPADISRHPRYCDIYMSAECCLQVCLTFSQLASVTLSDMLPCILTVSWTKTHVFHSAAVHLQKHFTKIPQYMTSLLRLHIKLGF